MVVVLYCFCVVSFCLIYLFFQVGLINKWGYTGEEFEVMTVDGYKLKIHRITSSPKNSSKEKEGKQVVYMQHGLLASSDSWVLQGPPKDFGNCNSKITRHNYYSCMHFR